MTQPIAIDLSSDPAALHRFVSLLWRATLTTTMERPGHMELTVTGRMRDDVLLRTSKGEARIPRGEEAELTVVWDYTYTPKVLA